MNLQELNQIQQETWTAGDFPKMGVELSIVGELLCEFVPLLAGDRVLDVATASGNTALAAARRRAIVTGVDITPALLERARLRAAAEGLHIDFQEGDATALTFDDASFDVVISTFRRDLRARSRKDGCGNGARLPARWKNRHGELDSRRSAGETVPHSGKVFAAGNTG